MKDCIYPLKDYNFKGVRTFEELEINITNSYFFVVNLFNYIFFYFYNKLNKIRETSMLILSFPQKNE